MMTKSETDLIVNRLMKKSLRTDILIKNIRVVGTSQTTGIVVARIITRNPPINKEETG